MAKTILGRVMPVDKGAYSASTTYAKLDMVHDSDSTYVSSKDNNIGHALTDTGWWTCYASGKAATEAAQTVLADEGSESGSTAGDGSRWGSYKAAEAARNTTAGNVEGTSGSTAGDGSRWGAYKSAEAARDTARETAEGTSSSAAGDNNRWGAYKTAEAARDTARSNAEGTASSTAGDGTRWGAYKTAEAARDTARATAEGTSSSTAGDGTRWGAYKTAEAERSATVDALEAEMENKANIDGWYKTLTSGFAENLVDTKGQGTEQTFTRRTSCGTESIADDGSALFKELRGNSIAWNQLIDTSTLLASGTYNGITYSYANGCITAVSGTADGASFSDSALGDIVIKLIQGHKYLLGKGGGTSSKHIQLFSTGAGNKAYATDTAESVIFTEEWPTNNWRMRVRVADGVTVNNDKFYFNIFDLTLMFGAGNEPSTVAEFEALYNKPYYANCEGEIINNEVSAYETVGFNQFDESTLQNGKWRDPGTGAESDIATRRRSDEYFPCFPSTNYFLQTDNVSGGNFIVCVCWYDADKNYISGSNGNNTLVTSPANARFFRVSSAELTGHICINLSWSGYRNGEYEAYWKKSLNVALKKLYGKLNGEGSMVQIFPNGGRSAGSVFDSVDLTKKEADVRLASVDLGSCETFNAEAAPLVSVADLANTIKATSSNTDVANILCSKYSISSREGVNTLGNSISVNVGGYVVLNDSGITSMMTTAQIQAYLSGVELVYELATPLHYTDVKISNDGGQTFEDVPIIQTVADFGTEYAAPTEEVDANGVPKSAPFRAVIKYADDFTRKLQTMDKNYQSQSSEDAFLAALGAAMNGTWTKTWDSTNSKYTYSFTPTENNG